jgi:uncharacterized membrane protein
LTVPLGLPLAVIAVVLLALVPIGWRGGWWPYRFSLLSLMGYSAYFGIAAVIVSVLALVISVFDRSAPCCTDQQPGAVRPPQRHLRKANVLRPPQLQHPV